MAMDQYREGGFSEGMCLSIVNRRARAKAPIEDPLKCYGHN